MASGMKRVVLDDFSGGVSSSGAFTSMTQLAKADGFVIHDAKRVRSQWAGELLNDDGIAPDVPVEVTQIDGINVFFYANGEVHVTASPELAASFGNIGGWNLGDSANMIDNGASGLMPSPLIDGRTHHPKVIGHGRWFAGGRWMQAAFVRDFSTKAGEINRTDMYIVGMFRVPFTGQGASDVEAISNGFWEAELYKGFGLYPNPDSVGDYQTGTLPKAHVACMWKDILVLGNIEWSQSGELTEQTKRQYDHMMWFMDPLNPSQAAGAPVSGIEPGARIIGLQECEEGLLVFTTRTSGMSGVVLLRGAPADHLGATSGGSVEHVAPLEISTRTAIGTESSTGSVSQWDSQQSVVFVTKHGRLYQYRNLRIADITPPSLGDNDFANAPASVADPIVAGGTVVASGNFLVFSNEATRTVSVFRTFGQTGAWTRLVGIEEGMFVHLVPHTQGFMAVVLGASRRFVSFNWNTTGTTAGSQRGKISNVAQALTLATAPVGYESPFVEKWWHQVGVRARCAANNPDATKVVAITTRGEAADGTVVEHREVLPAEMALLPNSGVFEYVVPAYGNGPTCQVEIEAEGDIIIESITIWYQPGTERW